MRVASVHSRPRSRSLAQAPFEQSAVCAARSRAVPYTLLGARYAHARANPGHLQALRGLPADIVIPPRIIVTADSFEKVGELVKKPRKPTKALRDLMAGKPVTGEP